MQKKKNQFVLSSYPGKPDNCVIRLNQRHLVYICPMNDFDRHSLHKYKKFSDPSGRT